MKLSKKSLQKKQASAELFIRIDKVLEHKPGSPAHELAGHLDAHHCESAHHEVTTQKP